MAPAAASFVVPIDRIAVTTAGRPVGMAETANATRSGTAPRMACPARARSRSRCASATPAMTRIWLVSALSCRVSGVTSSLVDLEHAADVADLGRHAGAATRIVPAPRVTCVFMNARSTRSPSAASAATAVDLLGDRDALAGQGRFVDLERGGRQDPAVGRDEVAGLDVDDVARDELLHRRPRRASRRGATLALTTIIFWRAATLAVALPSWLRPIAALSSVSPMSTIAGRRPARAGTG